jgi:acetyl esterase/lipase
MPGLPPAAVRPLMRLFSRWALGPRLDWPARRRRVDLGLRLPGPVRGTATTDRTLGGVPTVEVRPATDRGDLTVLYLHGGGFCVGSPVSYLGLTSRLAAAMQARVVVPDYRLAPEHPHPAQLEDAGAVFAALADETAPQRIVVAGDSAGGGLTLLLALERRDAGLPGPAALGLIAPWVDARPEVRTAQRVSPREPILTPGIMHAFSVAYLGAGADPTDPRVSPLFADLEGLPPCVLQTGGDDILTPTDGLPLLDRLRAAGVPVAHQDLAALWHVPHLAAHLLGPGVIDRLASALRAAATRPAPVPAHRN